MKNPIHIEGYWYSPTEPNYPKPVTNVLTQEEANTIFDLIKAKEKTARKKYYKGIFSSFAGSYYITVPKDRCKKIENGND